MHLLRGNERENGSFLKHIVLTSSYLLSCIYCSCDFIRATFVANYDFSSLSLRPCYCFLVVVKLLLDFLYTAKYKAGLAITNNFVPYKIKLMAVKVAL